MENNIKIELNSHIVQDLQNFSEILGKSPSEIINTALKDYFEKEQEKLDANTLDMDGGMTKMDFDEFWDGVDI